MKKFILAIRALFASAVAKDLYPDESPRYIAPPASFSQDIEGQFRVKLTHPNAKPPRRMTAGAAGYDVYSPTAGSCEPGKIARIDLGVAVEIPDGYAGLLVARSSFGVNYGAGVPNGFGLIDQDFRGSVAMILTTLKPLAWRAGDRLGQVVLVPILTPEVQVVEELSATSRTGGLGSTGIR